MPLGQEGSYRVKESQDPCTSAGRSLSQKNVFHCRPCGQLYAQDLGLLSHKCTSLNGPHRRQEKSMTTSPHLFHSISEWSIWSSFLWSGFFSGVHRKKKKKTANDLESPGFYTSNYSKVANNKIQDAAVPRLSQGEKGRDSDCWTWSALSAAPPLS